MGPPAQIIQMPDKLVFLYRRTCTVWFLSAPRTVPTSIRPIWAILLRSGTAMRSSSSQQLNDDTWLGPDGYFHTEAIHVVERFTRNGDT
jgi:hypothetical protein